MNTPYDQACKAGAVFFVVLAIVGLLFPATQAAILALAVMFAFVTITGGLVLFVVAGAKLAQWLNRMLG